MSLFGEIFEKLIESFEEHQETHEQYLEKLDEYKILVDKSPDRFLKFHLDNAVRDEHYELASYIKEEMENRGLNKH
ncbi:MAG: hypothetical protein KDC69_04645 [Flavobacteriaceae bacterium]|nr:hypothetical protein [Flavobacteriaceae bacterium]